MREPFAFVLLCTIGLIGFFCTPISAAPQYEIPLDTVIVLQNGNCEMGCPVYKVIVFANGDVIFQGRHHVRKTGVVLTNIQPDQVREILDGFKRIDYLHMENIYGLHGNGCTKTLPDEPIVITSLSMGGLSKTITHHRGCVSDASKNLSLLEDNIGRLTNTAQWTK